MSKNELFHPTTDKLTIELTPQMREQLSFFAEHSKNPVDEIAREFLAEELEAQVEIAGSPYGRRSIYRA